MLLRISVAMSANHVHTAMSFPVVAPLDWKFQLPMAYGNLRYLHANSGFKLDLSGSRGRLGWGEVCLDGWALRKVGFSMRLGIS